MEAVNYISRVESKFTQVPNALINDFPRFNERGVDGLRAYALIGLMYSKPDNWKFYRKNIAESMGLALRTLDKAIRAAKDLGWLVIEHHGYTSSGRPIYIWKVKIVESAAESLLPNTGKGVLPNTGKGVLPTTGKQTNTNSSNTNVSKTNNMATALPQDRVNKTIGWIATNIFGEANYKGEFQWEELEEVQEWIGRVLAESRYKETLVELEELAAEGLTFKEAIGELLEPR